MSETEIQAAIRKALGALPDFLCWRNHVGKIQDERGRWHTFGLAPGSADLIGLLTPHGRFVALEIKEPGKRPTSEQIDWLAMVQRTGGFAAVVRSPAEALAAVQRARNGEMG